MGAEGYSVQTIALNPFNVIEGDSAIEQVELTLKARELEKYVR